MLINAALLPDGLSLPLFLEIPALLPAAPLLRKPSWCYRPWAGTGLGPVPMASCVSLPLPFHARNRRVAGIFICYMSSPVQDVNSERAGTVFLVLCSKASAWHR